MNLLVYLFCRFLMTIMKIKAVCGWFSLMMLLSIWHASTVYYECLGESLTCIFYDTLLCVPVHPYLMSAYPTFPGLQCSLPAYPYPRSKQQFISRTLHNCFIAVTLHNNVIGYWAMLVYILVVFLFLILLTFPFLLLIFFIQQSSKFCSHDVFHKIQQILQLFQSLFVFPVNFKYLWNLWP